MKAVVVDRYGPPEVLRIEDVPRPAPDAHQVLIKVHATTMNRSDCGYRGAHPFFTRLFTGLRRPKRRIPGMEFAGVIEEIGSSVTEFEVGDEVFGVGGWGAHAEYVCRRADSALAHKPADMTFDEAASVPDGAIIALACVRKADPKPGTRMLIYGATGSIGTAAIQLAKHFGADVTAVVNTKNLELARSLGADQVIDWTREDFTKSGETYDAVFDSVGKHSFRRCRQSVKPGGIFIETDLGFMWHVPPLALATRWIGDRRLTLPIPSYTKENILFVKQLIDEGAYRAVIDRRYALEQIVEAATYVETGQKTGNVVITVGASGAGS